MSSTRVPLPEVDVEPLGDMMLDFLMEWDQEEAFLDFKETLSIAKDSAFAKIAKDILAFSNFGGGWILIGFRQKKSPDSESEPSSVRRSFLPIGLGESFRIDQADLQAKFNSYLDSESPIHLFYHEFLRVVTGQGKKFAAIYIPPSTQVLRPIKSGTFSDEKGKTHTAFRVSSVLIRRGTQSVVASNEETDWIKSRSEKTGYRISVLSGQPDQIQETLFANLFEVNVPEVIWTAPLKSKLDPSIKLPFEEVYVSWNNRIVTFEDITNPDSLLGPLIEPPGVQSEALSAWLSDVDKQRVIIQLLNKEIRFLALRRGFLQEPNRQKFYYACDGEYRTETWEPRYRASSTLKVAQRMWAQQLKRSIYWHVAVLARFTYLGNRLLLRLTPTLIITEDGRRAIFGPREGSVIARLTYNRYNSSYLNSLLFWIYKFAEGKESFTLAQDKVIITAKPLEANIGFGIAFDRPTAEPIQEIPEIEMEGDI